MSLRFQDVGYVVDAMGCFLNLKLITEHIGIDKNEIEV